MRVWPGAGSDYALPMWEQEEVARVGKAELMLQTYARKLLDRFPEVTLLTQVLMDADMPEAGPAMVRYAHIKQVRASAARHPAQPLVVMPLV